MTSDQERTQLASGGGSPEGRNLVLQDDEGNFYMIPWPDMQKFKVRDDQVGGGELSPAGCAVCCKF